MGGIVSQRRADEARRPVEGVFEHWTHPMPDPRIGDELRVPEAPDGLAEEVHARKRIGFAGEEQDGAMDGGPMRGPRFPLGVSRPVERITEEH